MAYNDYVAELIGSVPRLSPLLAGKLLNDAWRTIQDLRLWSFNVIPEGQLFVPASISAGTITVTFNSTVISSDATAKAALDAVELSNPPLAGASLGVGRQIRIASSSGNLSVPGPLYSIISYDNTTGNITIDRPYGEPTAAGVNYLCYRAYYAPALSSGAASPTLVRYFSLVNPSNGYSIRGRRLYFTQAQLNSIDPQRGATGDAYILAFLGPNSLGQPVHELYPHPVNQVTYTANMQVRQPALASSVDIPQMPYELQNVLMSLSKRKAAEWALANVSTYIELQNTNWVAYRQMQDSNYKDERIMCIKQDDETNPLLASLQGSLYDFPLGGQFLQSHDLSSLIPG